MRAIISIHALLAESDAFYNRFKPCARYFYPRSPCGERRSDIFPVLRFSLFLSTLSLRRATVSLQRWAAHLCDFYPRSPCGERLVAVCYDYYSIGFLSTLSLRRATETVFALLYEPDISIHALLAESDQRLPHLDIRAPNFYPRSPCGERLAQIRYLKLKLGFLSTLSLRRATHPRARCALGRPIFLSTLSLRRATCCGKCRYWGLSISIHALLAESDTLSMAAILISMAFLSTLSLRRAT